MYIDPSHFTDKYENNYSSPRVKERTPKLHGVRVSFSNKEQGVVFDPCEKHSLSGGMTKVEEVGGHFDMTRRTV